MGDLPKPAPKSEDRSSGSLADPVMLDKIDKLFACNVGDYIDLPQIVVVGDQSSGKSSVLEGLTNLPFPRDSGLCTRFATQITFRRSAAKRIAVSIVPAKGSSAEHAERIRTWAKEMEVLDKQTFANVMHEVHAVMGISTEPLNPKTFSDDVFCLEVCGPDEEHLSVIDVPGIFKRTTQGVTSKTDMQMVKSMVQGYMENPRSVILAVIPANVDIATQEILEMAEEVDPEGQRTLGVLTKPDLVDKGAESTVVDLIEGRRHPLALGWHCVRNLGQQESLDPTSNRHALEKDFFTRHSPYNSLSEDKVGIPALKIRLQEVIATHTRREFPKVKLELNKRLKTCRSSLQDLGASRDTSADQSKYLVEIATRFQEVVSLALDAKYWGNDIFERSTDLKIATLMVNRGEKFSKDIETLGHTYEFEVEGTTSAQQSSTTVKLAVKLKLAGDEPEMVVPKRFAVRYVGNHDEIGDILHDNQILSAPESQGILEWLTKVYRASRGFELGTFDPALLAITMREQSKKWNSIALGYISDVVTYVHNFFTVLLRAICHDERVRNGLTSILIDGLVDRYKKAVSQVDFILQVERSEKPTTQNHYFNDTLEKCRQKRMQQALSGKSFNDCSHGAVVRLQDILSHHPMSNIEHTVQDVHDILKSYYQVAWKRVVDVVCMQAAEHHLTSGPITPLKLFSPAFVGMLTREQLEEIAGEDSRQKRKRKQLQKEIEDLQKGKEILT